MVDDWTLRPRNWLAGVGEKPGEKSGEKRYAIAEDPSRAADAGGARAAPMGSRVVSPATG
jgi:hypothetical protein